MDYVLEEEEEEQKEEEIYEEYEEEEESPPPPPRRQPFLSPDSGVHFVERERDEEGEYAQPVKIATEGDLMAISLRGSNHFRKAICHFKAQNVL